jgi:hypothetical protein
MLVAYPRSAVRQASTRQGTLKMRGCVLQNEKMRGGGCRQRGIKFTCGGFSAHLDFVPLQRHHTSTQQLFGRRDLARCHTAFTADHSPSLARRVQTGLRPLGKPIRFLMPRPLLVCHGRGGVLRQRRQEVARYRLSALTSPRISCVGQRPLYGGEHRMQVGPPRPAA